MSEKWTDNQQKAIDIRNGNVLVSAAAGSGKTAVLVERVIKMITDSEFPVYVNNLLISTFTKAAAAEMKERIYTALRKKIAENPTDSHLKKQLMLLNQAQICTIHSFCINLLRENFNRVGLQHDFKVADEARLAAIKNRAINNVLDANYIAADDAFLNTVDTFGGKKNDDGLVSVINDIYTFSDSLANPEKWLENCTEHTRQIGEFRLLISEYIKERILNFAERYRASLDIIYEDPGLEPYIIPYEAELDAFSEIADSCYDPEVLETALLKFEFVKSLPRKKKEADENSANAVRKHRNYVKKAFPELLELVSYSDEDILDDISKMKPCLDEICRLTCEFSKEYSALKRAENVVDFSDLEHLTVKLLSENEDICFELQKKYSQIFIDEYQDTNGVQAFLFEKLSDGSNLFMVGDVKQSIYGFRNSDPKYFTEKYQSFKKDGGLGTNILLSENFRSSNGVLAFVNDIFKKLMSIKTGEVDYSDGHALVYANENVKNTDVSAEIHVVDCSADDGEPVETVQAEAVFVAERIVSIIEKEKPEVYDKSLGLLRPAEYRDIAVLMRSTNKAADIFASVFAARGIPVYNEEKGGYFGSMEIATVMSFLQIIENPLQDIPLLAVMRSPIFGFDDNLTASVRASDRYGHLYDVVKKSTEPKARYFIQVLDEYISLSKYNDVDILIRKIVYDTGFYSVVGCLPNGEKRMANLALLCERAADYCSDGFKGVLKFTEYIKNMIESGKEYQAAKMAGENDNAVTVTTIHKSKGLEFPIVFLSDTSHLFNVTDFAKPYIYDGELGLASDIIDTERNLKYVPFIKKAIAEKKKARLWSEEVRLLYVALTRAKYKVVVTCAVTDARALANECESLGANPYSFKSQNSYIKWILTSLGGKCATFHRLTDIYRRDEMTSYPVADSAFDSADYSEFYDEVDRRLKFSYPYGNCRNIPSKRSISEIAESGAEVIHLNKIEKINGKMSAAERGTLIHFVLQNIDLENVGSANAVSAQIEAMILKGMLKKEYAKALDAEALYGFFSSEIGKRMLAATKVYREFKFCVDLPAREIGFDSGEETVLVQGVIDCCFLEDGEFVIIDYKTGSMREEYKRQLELYARCLSVATGKKVRETHIYPLI